MLTLDINVTCLWAQQKIYLRNGPPIPPRQKLKKFRRHNSQVIRMSIGHFCKIREKMEGYSDNIKRFGLVQQNQRGDMF